MKKIENKSKTMKQVESKLGGDIEEILRALYVDRHMSINDMTKELGISYLTCVKWLRLAGIYSRKLKVD